MPLLLLAAALATSCSDEAPGGSEGPTDLGPADLGVADAGPDFGTDGARADSSTPECSEGDQRDCPDGSDVGECTPGAQRCVEGRWSQCTGSAEPAEEVCDGLDNDCDGVVDNGVLGVEEEGLPPDSTWIGFCGGPFVVGDDEGEARERPATAVVLESFYIQKTEVTVRRYEECVDAGACSPVERLVSSGGPEDICDYYIPGSDLVALNCASVAQMIEYADWLGNGARMCSESEWEYAAKAGDPNRRYPWGTDAPSCSHGLFDECIDSFGATTICSYTLGDGDYGLCDMAGNLWEVVADTWSDNHLNLPEDGSPNTEGQEGSFVAKGGSWNYTWDVCHSSWREKFPAFGVFPGGFRLCRDGRR